MQEPARWLKPKKRVILVLLILVSVAGLMGYFLIPYVLAKPPLTDGGGHTSGVSALTKINEIASAGFSVWNDGVSPLRIEKVEVKFNDNQTDLVEVVFIEISPNQGTGVLQGTPAQNGYTTYPVEGYTIDPKKEAQLYVSIKATALGNHSATRIIFTYTYQGLTYKYTYNIEEYFTLEVRN